MFYLMTVFMLLGALDRILGNRLGIGERFEEGILTFGSLALSMLGMLSLAPVLARVLSPVVEPVFRLLGADPGVFPGTLLACDMGGAALALEMAGSREAGLFGGILVGSMLGAAIVFTIPVALGIIRPADRPYLARGVLAGIVTIPIGAFVGGLCAGYAPGMLVRNLVPIVLFAALIALGLWRAEGVMVKAFILFGKLITAVITVGLAAAIAQELTGVTFIPGMAPLSDGFQVVGGIAIVLAGAFPLIDLVTRVCRKPLLALGGVLGMNETAAAGMVATLANSIPMFRMLEQMDSRGKLLNVAFAVSAAFVFGDHLGFTAEFAPELLGPMIVGKLVGGITAVLVGLLLSRREKL